MKVTLTFLIICFLAMGSFLISIGCSKGQQQPEPKSVQQQTLDMRTSADPEKEPLEGYMTPAESKRWLENNHYQVQKEADGNGYIITRDYYDPSTGSSDNSRLVIGDGGTVEVRKVLMTTDKNGEIRVKVTGAQ
jgi:hypothetical protein